MFVCFSPLSEEDMHETYRQVGRCSLFLRLEGVDPKAQMGSGSCAGVRGQNRETGYVPAHLMEVMRE